MATLKISDLSVGDWVGIDQAELNMPSDDLETAYIEKLRKPIRIKGISEDSDMVIADIEIVDEWGSIMMKCEHLRPIPITAEILGKNGFERSTSQFIVYHTDKVWISYDKPSETWSVTMYINDFTSNLHANILHIHQLQHTLRLAGVDKEINL
jgi:hypothetical protein